MMKLHRLAAAAALALASLGAAAVTVKVENQTTYPDADVADMVNKHMPEYLKAQFNERGLALGVIATQWKLSDRHMCFVEVGATHPRTGKAVARQPSARYHILRNVQEGNVGGCHGDSLIELVRDRVGDGGTFENVENTRYEAKAPSVGARNVNDFNYRSGLPKTGEIDMLKVLLELGFPKRIDSRYVEVDMFASQFNIGGQSMCVGSFGVRAKTPNGLNGRYDRNRSYGLWVARKGEVCEPHIAAFTAMKGYLKTTSASDLDATMRETTDGVQPKSTAEIAAAFRDMYAQLPN